MTLYLITITDYSAQFLHFNLYSFNKFHIMFSLVYNCLIIYNYDNLFYVFYSCQFIVVIPTIFFHLLLLLLFFILTLCGALCNLVFEVALQIILIPLYHPFVQPLWKYPSLTFIITSLNKKKVWHEVYIFVCFTVCFSFTMHKLPHWAMVKSS